MIGWQVSRRRACALAAGISASILLALVSPCEAQTQGITVELSEDVEKALKETEQNPERTRRKLERKINDGLKELSETDPDAKALFESGQKIRIVCFGSEEATKAGLTQDSDPLLGGDESGETRGDFDKDGKPKKGGIALIAIDCEALKRGEGFDKPAAGDKSTMFQVVIHELLHASNEARKHPPDTFDIYENFVKKFEEAVHKVAVRRANAAPGSTDPAPGQKAPADSAPPPPPPPAPEPPGHGSAVIPGAPGGMLASYGEGWGVGLGIGFQLQEVPSVDFGTLVTGVPGDEVAAVESEEFIPAVVAALRMQTPFGELQFEYVGGEAKESASEPVGGLPVAFVYYEPASGGSLGLNTGPNGGEFQIKSKLGQYVVSYDLPFTLHESEQEGRVVSSWEAGPALAFIRSEVDYRGQAMSTNIPGISTTTDQKVDENRYGIGALGRYERELAYSIVGTVEIDVELYYRDADLKSEQNNVCGAPGCPPANTFTANNRDSDSDVTWGAGIQLGLDYSPCEGSWLGLDLGYRYLGATAALRNPTSTIDFDSPPNLGGDDVNAWRVGLRYRYEF